MKHRPWTNAEEEFLRTNIVKLNGPRLREKFNEKFTKRSKKAIDRKVETLGLRYRNSNLTETHLRFIKDNWKKLTDLEMAEKLNCSTSAVASRRLKLKLNRFDLLPMNAEERKIFMDTYKNKKGCIICGEKDPIVLDFHHIDPATKEFSLGLNQATEEHMREEIEKCVVICSNCHRRVHAKTIQLPIK